MNDKQKEQARLRQQRYRQKQKSVTFSNGNVTDVTQAIPSVTLEPNMPANFGQPDCECKHCKNNRKNGSQHIINHGQYKPRHELGQKEINRVTFPSDPDYQATGITQHCDGLIMKDEVPSAADVMNMALENIGATV